MLDLLFNSDGRKAYNKAKEHMKKLHARSNSNIPDFNPFKFPTNKIFVKYPADSLIEGRIYQKNIVDKKNLRIYELNYSGMGQMQAHTHYGFYEYVYIRYGTFIDLQGIAYTKGDAFILDCYNAHSLKCLTANGSMFVSFSAIKTKLNIEILTKFI